MTVYTFLYDSLYFNKNIHSLPFDNLNLSVSFYNIHLYSYYYLSLFLILYLPDCYISHPLS